MSGRGGRPLWSRGDPPPDPAVERFTVGRDPELDLELLRYDLLASAAHATMLGRIGVLTGDELKPLLGELGAMLGEVERGAVRIAAAEEDGHTAIENRLTRRLGDAGRRLHTGRSRNDQVIAALRLYGRDAVLDQTAALADAAELLLGLADRHRDVSVAGYTHTRQAMPTTLGHLFAAHAAQLLDQVPWLKTAFRHLNRSPLGSASGYGVALPLDRELACELLGFDRVQVNTLAVQSDRGRTEYLVLGVAAAVLTDLSRLAADLIWYSSDELGYVALAGPTTTGSSIMPNKRNPDVLELVRANAARVRARHAEVGGCYGGLTSGYHRDLQLTKEPFLDGMRSCRDALRVVQPVLAGLTVDPGRCRRAMTRAIGATDAVYRQVKDGRPFRDAYREVGGDPAAAAAGDPAESWRERAHTGAPGALALDDDRARLAACREWCTERRAAIEPVRRLLPS